MQEVVASCKNVEFIYDNSLSFLSLDNVSFNVNKGDILGIIGPNGAGKSTLFRCMLGLLKNYNGEITILGHNIKKKQTSLSKNRLRTPAKIARSDISRNNTRNCFFRNDRQP